MRAELSKLVGLSGRLLEDRLYEITILEVEAGEYDNAARARAFEEAQGDEAKAKALYIKHRVRRLFDLIEVERKRIEETHREQKEMQRQQKIADSEYSYKLKTAFMSPVEKTFYDLGCKLKK